MRGPAHRRPQLEAGARLLHLHRVRPLHGGLPRHGRRDTLAPRQVILDIRDQLYDGDGAAPEPPVSGGRAWACTTRMACVEAPGGDRARADDRRHAPPPRPRGRARSAPPADARELQAGQLLRQVGPDAGSLEQEARLRRSRMRARSRSSTCGSWATSPRSTSACSTPRRASPGSCTTPASRSASSTRGSATRNDVRRIGEGLFEILAEQNLAALGEAEFEATTTDLHSLNALRNEYPQLGLDKPVYHYTELFADLVAKDVPRPHAVVRDTSTHHDPLLPRPLQPDHRGATEADRGDWGRACGDAAARDQHSAAALAAAASG